MNRSYLAIPVCGVALWLCIAPRAVAAPSGDNTGILAPSGGSAEPLASCTTGAQCTAPLPPTTPAGCAEWVCKTPTGGGEGTCILMAKDADHDGVRSDKCTANDSSVNVELGLDCDDTRASVHPGATEVCNGLDDNCNTVVDDGIPPSGTCFSGTGQCKRQGQYECANGTMSKCNAVPGTPRPDFPACDGKDSACDGPQQLGCDCTVGGTTGGSSDAATPDPRWGFLWCRRNCSVTKVMCVGGRFNCPAPAPNEQDEYCQDSDDDHYYVDSTCGQQCKSFSDDPNSPVRPIKPKRPDKYILKSAALGGNDCNDNVRPINPGVTEKCLPANVDENCDGNPYDSLPRPGTTASCPKICNGQVAYPGSQKASASCVFSACKADPAEEFGRVVKDGQQIPLSRVPVERPWLHAWGERCDGDRHWCALGTGSDEIIRGPHVQLPAGRYLLHVKGSHSTSSTWVWVEDDGQEVAGTARNFIAPTAFKLRIDTEIAFSVPAGSDCHSYQIKVRATPHGWFAYGVTVEEIWITRQ